MGSVNGRRVSTSRAVAAVCLLLARPLAADGGLAAEVAAWLAGTFELKDPGVDGVPEAVRVVIVVVPKSRIANGALVVYREQAAAPKLDDPTQQRFYRLEEDGDVVRMRAFDPKDPVLVRGKWRDPSALALYGASDMRERPGCTMLLKKKGDLWEGETPGTDCPSTVKSSVTMTSVLILAQDGFTQWDRGFDEKGRQTWKSPEGGMRFLKRSMNAPVDDKLIERPVGRRAERAAEKGENVNAAGTAGTTAAIPAAGEAKAKNGFSANGNEGSGAVTDSKGPLSSCSAPIHLPRKSPLRRFEPVTRRASRFAECSIFLACPRKARPRGARCRPPCSSSQGATVTPRHSRSTRFSRPTGRSST